MSATKFTHQVRVYQLRNGRFAFVWLDDGHCSHGNWATAAYARKVARENGGVVVK